MRLQPDKVNPEQRIEGLAWGSRRTTSHRRAMEHTIELEADEAGPVTSWVWFQAAAETGSAAAGEMSVERSPRSVRFSGIAHLPLRI